MDKTTTKKYIKKVIIFSIIFIVSLIITKNSGISLILSISISLWILIIGYFSTMDDLCVIFLITVVITGIFIPLTVFLINFYVLYLHTIWNLLFFVIIPIVAIVLVIAIPIILISRHKERKLKEFLEHITERKSEKEISKIIYCSECDAEILDTIGDFCSQCGAKLRNHNANP